MSEQFGHYVLETMIGRGGMGEVYRAYDTRRDRIVALKRLPKDLANDEIFQARFRRECRLVAKLNEPHVIPIHDFGEINGHLFLDMRLVEGVDLSTVIADEGRLGPKLAVDVIGQVAAALQSAHNSGLIHRDVKPSNVLVTGMTADRQSGFAYLVDFGIARSESGGGGTALTSTTGTVGTLGYMAPERISGLEGDSRSDLYSLACVLYECLTGHSPFKGETFQVMYAHVNAPPPLPSAEIPGLPRALDDVIRRGLAKEPADRFQTASQFAAAARAALVDAGVTPPPPSFVAGPGPGGPGPGRAGPGGPVPPQGAPSGPIGPPRPAAAAGPPRSGAPFGPPTRPPAGPPAGPPGGPPGGPQSGRPIPPPTGPPAGPPVGPPAGPPRGPAFGPTSGPQPRQPASGPMPPTGPSSGPMPPYQPPGRPGSPPPPGRPGGAGGSGPGFFGNRRNLIPIVVAAVVVLAAVIIIVVVTTGGGGSPQANGTTTPTPTASASGSGTVTDSSAPPSTTSSTTTPGWSNYSDFTDLIGNHGGDTVNAYKGATCNLKDPDSDVKGMLDQIECTNLSGSKAEFYVGRFSAGSDVTAYGTNLVNTRKYTKTYWTINSMRRGLLYKSPTSAGYADVTSSICSMPTFLIQFYAGTSTKISIDTVFTDLWKPAPFPNDTPAVCG